MTEPFRIAATGLFISQMPFLSPKWQCQSLP